MYRYYHIYTDTVNILPAINYLQYWKFANTRDSHVIKSTLIRRHC